MHNRIANFSKLYLAVITALCFPSSLAVAATGFSEHAFLADGISWIVTQQRTFHEHLITALRMFKVDGNSAAVGSLLVGSFLYGIFHAAGPGHGKIVLTTYLLTHPHKLSQGISIAAIGALCQGIVAIILVYGLLYLAEWIPRETNTAVLWSERTSYTLMALIGALLILKIVRQELNRFFLKTQTAALPNHNEHNIDGCGHNHMPSEEHMEQISGFFSVLSVVFAMGLRPCIGAVLVLVLAKTVTLPWAGAGAVIAMSAGTSITVAALAFLAVKVRRKAVSQITNRNLFFQVAVKCVTLIGGSTLIFIGASLLIGSFHTRHPLGL
mgnify:CR=1 FL=1